MANDNSYAVLFEAIMKQDKDMRLKALQSLIEAGTNVNSYNSSGDSVLHLAASHGHVECVQLLLKSGANANRSSTGKTETAVIKASQNGHLKCLRVLLEAGANVDKKYFYGETPLIVAASSRHFGCVRLLLEFGANVNSVDIKRHTALMEASRRGDVDSVKLLLEAGANVDAVDITGQTALMLAVSDGHVTCLRLLLEAGGNVNNANTRKDTALICFLDCYVSYRHRTSQCKTSIEKDEVKACLKLLIKAGADIDARNYRHLQPIHYALTIWPRYKFAAEYLVSENCNLSQASHDKIQTTVRTDYLTEEDRLDILKLLFACGLPRHLCQSFIVKQDPSIRNWVETVALQPNTLTSICVFEIRRSLGHSIKSKVEKLHLPNVIKNLILRKGILSPECFI